MRFTRALLAAFDPATVLAAAANQPPRRPAVMPAVGSPFANTNLNQVVWPDLGFGPDQGPMSRDIAMTLPPIARQRHLVAGTAARLAMGAWQGDTDLGPPKWATRTDRELSPFHRMLWTYDDHIFYGWSLWDAERDTDTLELLAVDRIAQERWGIDPMGRVTVDGEVRNASTVILIPGPHEGILTFGAPSIRMALSNARAASRAARNPSAFTELHNTGEEQLTDDQIAALTNAWTVARNAENGGVAYTPQTIEVRNHGTHEGQLLIQGRNADAVDMSRLVSSPAAMADATNAGASLTYETSTGRNGEFIDYGLALYIAAVDARLSMDDVVPPGVRMETDTSSIRDVAAVAPIGPGRVD